MREQRSFDFNADGRRIISFEDRVLRKVSNAFSIIAPAIL